MRSVIETGARFLLDPRQKHEPTLISPDPAGRERRIEFYKYAIDCAAELGSDCVSLWSGVLRERRPRDAGHGPARRRACSRCSTMRPSRQVAIGFEPEPGMLIDSMRGLRGAARADRRAESAADARRRPPALPGRDADRRRDPPLGARGWSTSTSRTCAPGVHEHLMFGEGEIDFPPVLRGASARSATRGGVHVELSRHSHEGARGGPAGDASF